MGLLGWVIGFIGFVELIWFVESHGLLSLLGLLDSNMNCYLSLNLNLNLNLSFNCLLGASIHILPLIARGELDNKEGKEISVGREKFGPPE